ENFYSVRAIAFAPAGEEVAYGTGDGSVWLWDLKDKGSRKVGRHVPPRGAINRVRLVHFRSAKRLLSVAESGEGSEGDLEQTPAKPTPLPLLDGTKHAIFRASLSPDGKLIAVATKGPVVHVRSLDGAQRIDVPLEGGQFPRSVAFDGRGRLAVGVGTLVP